MISLILAGGKGTRLQSVLADRPKPMALVDGRPFLEWLLLCLRERNVTNVVLSTGHLGGMIEDSFGDGRRLGMRIVHSREVTPLGTGGAVRLALSLLVGERCLVLNGDSFCPFDPIRLLAVHQQTRARATMWLAQVEDCNRYGSVDIDERHGVLAFREKAQRTGPGLINAGIYLLEREVIEAIPQGRPVSLETEIFPALVGHGLHAVVGGGPFIDIGTPQSYADSQGFFERLAGA